MIAKFGCRAKATRERLGLSQDAAAHALGMPLRRLLELERGADRFGARELQALAKLLAVSPQYLFEDIMLPCVRDQQETDRNDSRAMPRNN